MAIGSRQQGVTKGPQSFWCWLPKFLALFAMAGPSSSVGKRGEQRQSNDGSLVRMPTRLVCGRYWRLNKLAGMAFGGGGVGTKLLVDQCTFQLVCQEEV